MLPGFGRPVRVGIHLQISIPRRNGVGAQIQVLEENRVREPRLLERRVHTHRAIGCDKRVDQRRRVIVTLRKLGKCDRQVIQCAGVRRFAAHGLAQVGDSLVDVPPD